MITALLAAAAVAATGCDLERPSGEPGCLRAAVDALPMTALQVVGTHNSYKEPIAPAEMKLLRAASPRTADSLDYSHPTLTAQLDAGARQLELDLVRDPEGGRWTRPLGLRMAGGGDYDALRPHALPITLFGGTFLLLDLPWLIRVKRAAGRPKDLEVVAELEVLQEEIDRDG